MVTGPDPLSPPEREHDPNSYVAVRLAYADEPFRKVPVPIRKFPVRSLETAFERPTFATITIQGGIDGVQARNLTYY